MFVLALIPLSLILRKVRAAYQFLGSKEKINHFLFVDNLNLYNCIEKVLDSLDQTICVFSEDTGMEFGIEKCAIEYCIELAVRYLKVCVHGSEERLIQTDRVDGLKAASVLKKAKQEKRLQDWEEKA